MVRMKIFNTLEEEAFESPPVFNIEERKQFFSLPLMGLYAQTAENSES